MIRVVYEKTKSKREITISGHANYDEVGKDIVCSAISTLFYTLARALSDVSDEFESFMVNDTKGGYVLCVGDISENTDVIIDTIINGIKMVADDYPENVKFYMSEVRN